MARYRVGDRYLSEEEYKKETDGAWALGLFFIGAIAVGISVYSGLKGFEFPKWANFTIICISSVLGGSILGHLQQYIRKLILAAFVVGFILLIGLIIWNIL